MAKNSKKSASPGEESRISGERIPVNILVDYKSKGTYLFDFCRDLGAGGVFIATDKPSAVGEELELSFTIPDAKKTLSIKGKVTWIQAKIEAKPHVSPGMGVQFKDFSSEQRRMLEEFVERYAAFLKKPA